MKKLLFVGDSHVAALRMALNANPALASSGTFDFFYHPSLVDRNLGDIECTGETCSLQAPRSKQSRRVTHASGSFRPDDHDAIVLVGLRTELPYALWNNWSCEPDEVAEGKRHMSAAAYRASLIDLIERQSLALTVARRIRSISSRRLILMPNPYIDEALHRRAIHFAPGIDGEGLFKADRIRHDSLKLADWKLAIRDVFASCKTEVLFQPDDTIAGSIFTRKEFSMGRASQVEMRHMNKEFGRIAMECLLQQVEQAPTGTC